jgi:eukaryotic-like serine/threonine-protein kinase
MRRFPIPSYRLISTFRRATNVTMPSGTKLGRYEIRSKIGAGGMGEVYLAQDTKLDRKVALKILPAELANQQDRMRRFTQEAKSAAALNHPNIAHIYEIGEALLASAQNSSSSDAGEHVHFISMEFVDGLTLRELIHEKQTDLPKLLRYLQHTAEGLSKAHTAGIVHRDLKPDNIMVTREGHAKILDFGLAKLMEQRPMPGGDSSEVATAVMHQRSTPGMIMGTVGYMSPEQAQGRVDEIDHRSDIFSFGCVLFESATGHKPFAGKDTLDSLHNIVHAPTPLIKNFNPLAPDELQRIVRRCLAKDPEERYQTIKDVAIEIKELRRELASATQSGTVSALTSSAGSSFATLSSATEVTVPPQSTAASSAEYLVSKVRRHKFFVFGLLAVLALAAIGFAVYMFKAAPPGMAKHFTSARNLKITRLTSSGKIADIAMSPDGKYVAYVIEDVGKRSIRLRQTATASDVEIVVPDENKIQGLSFTPDGVYLYYLRIVQNLGTVFQIPALGGQPRKIVVDADSGTAVSSDGKQIAFLRESEHGSSLMMANADGSNQQTLLELQGNDSFWGYAVPSWSADGKTIACGALLRDNEETHLKLMGVNTKDGTRRLLSDRNWSVVAGVQWLPDGNLIVSGNEKSETEFAPLQLWLVTPSGAPQRLTNDLNDYMGASATASGDSLVTLQDKQVTNLWLAPNNDAARAVQIAPASEIWNGIEWTPDGNFIYCSKAGGKFDIWTMNSNGTNQKQVSSGEGAKYNPQMTRDGRFIVFCLSRRGISNIWRMDADGSNVKQLTNGSTEFRPTLSPDGRWIIYEKLENNLHALWKVSIEGGAPVQLTNTLSFTLAVSPRDGMIAYFFNDTEANMLRKVAIISSDGGKPLKTFAMPPTADSSKMHFTPDGRAVAFLDSRGGGANIWTIALDGNGEAEPLTDFKTEKIFDFAWSNDGKQLVVIRGTRISDAVLISENY